MDRVQTIKQALRLLGDEIVDVITAVDGYHITVSTKEGNNYTIKITV